MRRTNRGFALIAAIILIVVAAAMSAVLVTMVAGSTVSGGMHIGSGQALYAAEAGIERGLFERNRNSWNCTTPASYSATVTSGGAAAAYTVTCARYNPGTATTLTSNITSSSTTIPVVSLAGYAPYGRVKIGSETIDYSAISTTSCGSFSPPCLINAKRGAENTSAVSHNSGTSVPQDHYIVTAVGTGDPTTQRTLNAILTVPGNLLPSSSNADFNAPPYTPPPPGPSPTNWILNGTADAGLPYTPWDPVGGPDNSRSAFARKTNSGPGSSTSAGQFTFSVPITVIAPTTLTLTFDYRHWTSEGRGNGMQVSFRLKDSVGTLYPATVYPFESGNTVPGASNSWPAVGCDTGCSPPTGTTGYQTGTVTFTIGGSGTVNITDLEFDLIAKPGRPKWIWIDNLSVQGGGATTALVIRLWRENFP